MKTKVLYIIYSSTNSSGGGHFYSLDAISKGLSSIIDFKILNLGAVYAKPLRDVDNTYFINLFKFSFFTKIFSVYSFVKEFEPEVIHAFDFNALFIARSISFFYKAKVVYTKCGGGNGSNYIPDADVQILFSKENLDHFHKYSTTHIPRYLLPNRVNLTKKDEIHIQNFKEKFNLTDKFILLRISRFNSYYDLSFRQSISLLKQALKYNEDAVLVFVGQIQNEDYFQELQSSVESDLPILFITTDVYTKKASRLIDVADVVIATGRGAMEACSLNKTVFCPLKNTNLPILLNDESIESLTKTNFSERGKYDDRTKIYDFVWENEFKIDTLKYFEKYFKVESVINDYKIIYRQKTTNKFRLGNYLSHLIRFFKI